MLQEKYKKLFLVEADEKIAALNSALLGLEKKSGDLNFANDAMRAAHTLKSSASAMNFMGISHLSHAMEDLFEQVRINKRQLEPETLEILFKNVDILSSAVKAIKNKKSEPNMKVALERLQKTVSGHQTLVSNEDNLKPNDPVSSTFVEPIEAIKVDVPILDRLMNLTEELLVEKMKLDEIVKLVENESVQEKNLKSKILNLKSINESFNRLFSDLQFNVVQARMVPLGQIFERFPRMVRDLAKEQKKEIDFEMHGQEIELDRTIIDRLGEPLIHLLRNAIDHGIPVTSAGKQGKGTITLSAERERDKVLIKVENEGLSLDLQKIVEVALSRGLIDKNTRNKYAKDITSWKSEIEKLLYLGQLSTSEKVTEVSGRGVGLSIVKKVIESFGGRVFIESPVISDQKSVTGGTRFTLELPLTLAIIQALLVRVGSQTFALPFSQIDRSVRVPVKNIKKVFDQEVAVVEEEDIPMVRLNKLFGLQEHKEILPSEEEIKFKSHQSKAELIIISKKDNHLSVGLVIDEMIAEQDIVVKPFKGALKQSKGFAGVTLLGDGRPALILDVATLL